jgi:hypothetical protein
VLRRLWSRDLRLRVWDRIKVSQGIDYTGHLIRPLCTDTQHTTMEPQQRDPTCAVLLPSAPSLLLGSMWMSYTRSLDFNATAQAGQCSRLQVAIYNRTTLYCRSRSVLHAKGKREDSMAWLQTRGKDCRGVCRWYPLQDPDRCYQQSL